MMICSVMIYYWRNKNRAINSLKTYPYENVPFNGTPSNCKYILKKCKYQYILYCNYVLLIVNVNRNKLNVNGSKCKCTCNIVIFRELKKP